MLAKKQLCPLLLLSSLNIITLSAQSAETQITTLEMSDIRPDASCHNYCWVGFCLWLRCSLAGCQTGIVNKVRNNNPDFVVTVFNEPGDEPWVEMQTLWGDVQQSTTEAIVSTFSSVTASGGFRDHEAQTAVAEEGGEDNQLQFKEVNVYGHPAALLFGQNFNQDQLTLWCPSQVTPLLPYFSSALDSFEWRWGIGEALRPETWIPNASLIGSHFLQHWGSVFPRTGFVNQKEDPKAAAIAAYRAAHIVTTSQDSLPHLSLPLTDNNGVHKTWFPGELQENNPDNHVWQMLAPKKDQQCYALGENDVLKKSWADNRLSDDQKYVFAVWRSYSCCQIPGVLIADWELEEAVCL